MSILTEALSKTFNWLQTHDPEAENLPPGLTLHQIQELTQRLPFKLPKEVCELYQYCNGPISPAPDLRLFSLEEALNTCRSYIYTEVFISLGYSSKERSQNFCDFMKQPSSDKFLFDNYPLNTYLFPLFIDNELYYINCDKSEKNFSPIWVQFPGEKAKNYAASLTNLILTITECYATGGYYVAFDEKAGFSYLAQDLKKIELIFHKYNPEQIDIWRSIWKDE